MPARKRPLHPKKIEEMREKIKSTLLINKLQNYALVNLTSKDFAKKSMTDGQVRATLGLLKKIIPDISTTQIQGDPENPLEMEMKGVLTREQLIVELAARGLPTKLFKD